MRLIVTGVPSADNASRPDGIFSWEVIKNCLSVGSSLSANRARDGADHFYTLLAESLVLNWSLTKQLDFFTECYALTPSGGAASPSGLPRRGES
jgi:hypothetical protein